jgi:5'-nucleotidase
MFQGTLASNLGEGAMVIEAMNQLGYAAAAIGNHEYDFGPVGEAATPRLPSDNPRGALMARASEAKFPFLAANTVDKATGKLWAPPNVLPSVLVEAGGVAVGLIGVTTEDTPRTTMAQNVAGLEFTALAPAIEREARALRGRGAKVVVVAAHAGGQCTGVDRPETARCEPEQEIMTVAASLTAGLVDVIVAGHTHKGMATRLNGIAIVQAYSYTTAFSRVDVRVDAKTGRVVDTTVFAPTELVVPAQYEGAPVERQPAIAAAARDDLERARVRSEASLGVTLLGPITRSYDHESAEGNLFVDLMLAAWPEADVALQNGGGLRADLPAGPLTYGALFEAYPFDNRLAKVRVSGRELGAMVAANLRKKGGILSIGGVRARAGCDATGPKVELIRPSGKPLRDDETVLVLISDFLATGGDGLLAAAGVEQARVTIVDELVREGMARALERRGGTLRAVQIFDAKKPRLAYPGERPMACRR